MVSVSGAPGVSASPSEQATNQKREALQRKIFAGFDQDKNGRLSEKEFVDVIIANLFKDFDTNKNGKITRKEFFAYAIDQKQAKKEYPMMDTEGKGYISLQNVYRNKPLIQRLKQEFRKLDSQSKGYVTLADLPDLTPDH